jgi:hypothetical protein
MPKKSKPELIRAKLEKEIVRNDLLEIIESHAESLPVAKITFLGRLPPAREASFFALIEHLLQAGPPQFTVCKKFVLKGGALRSGWLLTLEDPNVTPLEEAATKLLKAFRSFQPLAKEEAPTPIVQGHRRPAPLADPVKPQQNRIKVIERGVGTFTDDEGRVSPGLIMEVPLAWAPPPPSVAVIDPQTGRPRNRGAFTTRG